MIFFHLQLIAKFIKRHFTINTLVKNSQKYSIYFVIILFQGFFDIRNLSSGYVAATQL